jgi:hypothetical protein
MMGIVLDRDTVATVHNMVRYIACDRKIARYVGCPLEYVANVRRQHRPSNEVRFIMRPLKPPHPEILDADHDHWAIQARKGTALLAEAIARAR